MCTGQVRADFSLQLHISADHFGGPPTGDHQSSVLSEASCHGQNHDHSSLYPFSAPSPWGSSFSAVKWTTLYMSRVSRPGFYSPSSALLRCPDTLAGGWSISNALAAGDTLAYEASFSPHVPRCLFLVLWPPAACCGGSCGPTVLSLNGVMIPI